jgi:hypothetical protein
MNKQMTTGAMLKSWAIVNFASHMTRPDEISKFVEVLIKVSVIFAIFDQLCRIGHMLSLSPCRPRAPQVSS